MHDTLSPRPRILFVVTEDFYFCSHRMHLAQAFRDAGAEVHVAAAEKRHRDAIEAEGFVFHPVEFDRRGLNPLRETVTIRRLMDVMRGVAPDVVHLVALKPILYGALAARLARVPHVVAAVAGMGFVFLPGRGTRTVLRHIAKWWYRFFLRGRPGVRAIVQNPDDRAYFVIRDMLTPSQIFVVPGSGVDTDRFTPVPPPPAPPVRILTHSRMLWDKGIGELVEAARLLSEKGLDVEFLLAGEPDAKNPAAIPSATLREWDGRHGVRWIGRQDDIPALLARSHIACLPSYREGLPLSLIEAAAAGLPLIAADVPGCREICRHGENGLLHVVRDPASLAEAVERLARDPELRARFGARSRELAEQIFSKEAVVRGTFAVYRGLLGREWPA